MTSLCMICGNEQGVILRCLESARGAFDELCLVQAIGDLKPDNTLTLAAEWCAANGKAFRHAEYKNKVPLPHIDNFGAARQLSFDLATCDWQLWLDCDDYLDEINCARLRELSKDTQYDAYYCTYVIEKHGAELLRERLIQRGKGRWKNPIHETCVVDQSKSATCDQVRIFHGDHQHKNQSSAQRNAMILEQVLNDAPRHYFYLQAEYKMLGKNAEAKKAAKAALVLLEQEKVEERYNVLLNLAQVEPEREQEHLIAALKVQPHRREALAFLCQFSLKTGNISDSISYFRMMDALPLPSPLPWTHQGVWYGWARNFLRVKVLRVSGKTEQAEKEHAQFMQDLEYAAGVLKHEKGEEV